MTAPPLSLWQELRNTPFAQGWADARGIRTRYLHAGQKGQPALIFLHGTGGHSEAYLRNLAVHGREFDTWAVDMLGHGWTDKPAHPYEIKHYVDHLVRFMDSQSIAKAHLSGESLGGWVASQFAIDHPDRVDRLVLNTAGGFRAEPAVMEKIKSLSMRAVQEPSWDFIKARVEWLMADPRHATPDLVACRQAIYSQPGAVDAMKNALVLQEMDVRLRNLIDANDYASIAAPTLVLWTSHDPTADVSEGRRLSRMIPGAQFVVMDGCGHWPQWEDAATFNRLHIGFLNGQAVAQP